LTVLVGDVVPRMKSGSRQRALLWIGCAGLFICLTTLNNIFFGKYHLPAFRLHSIAGFLGR